MVELASHILQTKAAHFDPSKFKDEYEDALKALVRRKASGKPIKVAEPEEKPDNVVNLMDALKGEPEGQAGREASGARVAARTGTRAAKKAHRSTARHRKAG
jgi:non-homologous end joining protein Ku